LSPLVRTIIIYIRPVSVTLIYIASQFIPELVSISRKPGMLGYLKKITEWRERGSTPRIGSELHM
jgi:hypothetical protein